MRGFMWPLIRRRDVGGRAFFWAVAPWEPSAALLHCDGSMSINAGRADPALLVLHADRDLLRRFREGERSALESVYWAHVDRVTRIVRFGFNIQRTGVSVPGLGRLDDLPDVVQEVFIKAFSPAARESYDGLREYGPYLARIAGHALVDRLRGEGREILVDVRDLENAMEALAAAHGSSTTVETDPWLDPDLVTETETYVRELHPELRAVHEKRFVLSLSQRDAAGALGMTRRHLRTLEERLRKGLARRLRRKL